LRDWQGNKKLLCRGEGEEKVHRKRKNAWEEGRVVRLSGLGESKDQEIEKYHKNYRGSVSSKTGTRGREEPFSVVLGEDCCWREAHVYSEGFRSSLGKRDGVLKALTEKGLHVLGGCLASMQL